MIEENKWPQYGYERTSTDIQGITLHNIEGLSASEYTDYFNNICKDNECWHYIVDHEGAVQLMPNNWTTYHTGKNNDWGDQHTISINICTNINDELYIQGQDNALELIKDLLSEYNLSRNEVFFHKDFNQIVFCPSSILNIYGNKRNFLDSYFNEEGEE